MPNQDRQINQPKPLCSWEMAEVEKIFVFYFFLQKITRKMFKWWESLEENFSVTICHQSSVTSSKSEEFCRWPCKILIFGCGWGSGMGHFSAESDTLSYVISYDGSFSSDYLGGPVIFSLINLCSQLITGVIQPFLSYDLPWRWGYGGR